MDMNNIFAENLKRIRTGKGLTQGELGDAIGYSNKAVSKWESGGGIPGVEILLRLSRVLEVDLNTLIRTEEPVYYLGIDGGGTKTALALADTNGKVLRITKAPGCNPVDIGMDRSQTILRSAIDEILGQIPRSSVSLYAGIAGGTTGDHQQQFAEFFRSLGFHRAQNHNDAQNAIAAGLRGKDGVLAILGTGSIVYAVTGETRHRIGGYGYLFGDAGSGYNIGNLGIQAAFAATDGSGPDTLLKEKIDSYAGAAFPQNVGFFYAGGKRCIAACAPLVLEACMEGDTVASQILTSAMAAFAPQLTAAAHRVAEKDPIVLAGGLMRRAELLLPILKKQLPEEIGERITVCREDPAIGALLLAGAPIEEGEHIC